MSYLRRWMENWIRYLSQPRAEFNGLAACPFSAKSTFCVVSVADHIELAKFLRFIRLPEPYNVLCVIVDFPQGVREVMKVNRPILAQQNILGMVSDPQHPMNIAGFQTTQKDYFMVIFQRKDELEKASERLRKSHYYDHWDEEQLRWLENRE